MKRSKGKLVYQLTAVTIYHHGVNHTVFMNLPVDFDGKVRITRTTYDTLVNRVTAGERGRTICFGGVSH